MLTVNLEQRRAKQEAQPGKKISSKQQTGSMHDTCNKILDNVLETCSEKELALKLDFN